MSGLLVALFQASALSINVSPVGVSSSLDSTVTVNVEASWSAVDSPLDSTWDNQYEIAYVVDDWGVNGTGWPGMRVTATAQTDWAFQTEIGIDQTREICVKSYLRRTPPPPKYPDAVAVSLELRVCRGGGGTTDMEIVDCPPIPRKVFSDKLCALYSKDGMQ